LIALTILVAAILAPVVIVTGFFALEVIAGLFPLGSQSASAANARTVIVIAAHDEQPVIGATVAALRSVAGKQFAILVVADNCADETAEAAGEAGAEVVIREDPEHRGKGFALAAAREHLQADPPDVVIVLDADCRLDASSAGTLAASAMTSKRPCQAVNLLEPDLGGPPLVQISTFAFLIKNLIRQRGLQRLAGTAHLTGTGMALPWHIFSAVDLGGSNIVEDLALGLQLAEGEAPPVLVEGATVWSPAASPDGTLVQRRRWEGGYLATAVSTAPRALVRSLAGAGLRRLCAALDLCVPPLALLAVVNAIAFAIALLAAVAGAGSWPLAVQVAAGILAFLALALAWAREGRRFASGPTLLRLPLYVIWKLPMYLGLVRRGAPEEWLRTGR
jgi:cellulose synthase/poly-beta-1,6-N-acetylglucosamine synthase-like glycosyltransferase